MTLLYYVSWVVGLRILFVAIGLAALALGLDLLNNGTDIIADPQTGSLSRYMILRAPLLTLNTIPVAFLIGPILAFLKMGADSELVILRASGMSPYRLVWAFVPLGILCGCLLYLLTDQIAPRLETMLITEFSNAEDVRAARAQPGEVWIRSGFDVVRIGAVGGGDDRYERGAILSDVSIFKLDEQSVLNYWVDAREARFQDDGWLLFGVTERRPGQPVVDAPQSQPWNTRLKPDFIAKLATASEAVDASTARQALSGLGLGPRGPAFYETRILRGYMTLALPFILFLFAVPVGWRGGRSGPGNRYAAIGILLGFCFLAADGLMASFGESEIVSPQIAAFAAPVAFTLIGFWLILVIVE